MLLTLGPLKVKIKYTYTRGKTTFYQRAVPSDLHDRYPGKTIKKDLKTADPIRVARMVEALNKQYETEWEALRSSPELSPKTLTIHADKWLEQHGLKPHSKDNDPKAIELLLDQIDRKRERWADQQDDPEAAYKNPEPDKYLTAVEIEAGRRLFGKKQPVLSDALDFYLQTHKNRNNAKFVEYQSRAFGNLIEAVGDKPVVSLTRADVRLYVDKAVSNGQKTATVRRRLNVMSAVFSKWVIENSLTIANPFARIEIPDEGKDKIKRRVFTVDELQTLYHRCQSLDDDLRWLVALMIDTGPRIGEVAGLALSDIVLDHTVPHILIQEHPWRSLKNEGSARKVPLVGASLWAAQRIVSSAMTGQKFAFPRYTSDKECKATSASGAANQFIRQTVTDGTSHCFRHTIADRLRNAGCPKEILFSIDGHASKDVGDKYGYGHGLEIKRQWLEKVALVTGSSPN